MQLNRLVIHNIASLADATIDFADGPLSSAPIFLITGETGAGKSTILDAICLALYGKTPRMSAASKEEIAAFDGKDTKYYANDNSQFLRRGTGEGFARLCYTGNDGVEYEATWEIQRDYKKPERKLQPPKQTLISEDGTYSEHRKTQIETKIKSTVGLDFSQFCRTVMLAQGEFTKFLKSDRNEKSVILEKLTGTDIYSKIGSEIAAEYADRKNVLDRAKDLVANVKVLNDDERTAMQEDMGRLDSESVALQSERNALNDSLTWLQTLARLEQQVKDSEERLALLEKEEKSEQMIEDKRTVADYRKSQNAQTLLKERRELAQTEADKEKEEQSLEEKRKSAVDKADSGKQAVEDQSKVVDKISAEATQYDLPAINEAIRKSNEKRARFTALLGDMKDYESVTETINTLNEGKSESEEIKKREEKLIIDLSEMIAEAKRKAEEAVERYAKVELSTTDAAKALRACLTKGEACPVCGQKVEEAVSDAVFDSVLEPLRVEKEKAEKTLTDLTSKNIASEHLKKDAERKIEQYIKKIETQKSRLEKVRTVLESHYNHPEMNVFSGATPLFENDILNPALKPKITEAIEAERKLIEAETEKQTAAMAINDRLQKARTKEDKLKKEYERLKSACDDIKLKITKFNTEKSVRAARRDEIAAALDKFYAANPEITEARVSELLSLSEGSVEKMDERVKKVVAGIHRETGAKESLHAQLTEHEGKRPERFKVVSEDGEPLEATEDTSAEAASSVSVEELSLQLADIEGKLTSCNQRLGGLREQLAKDETERLALQSKLEKVESARADLELWEGLYRLLGDTNGARFRSVAQSFILRMLLESANKYMSCFTDRYTLTCNAGSLAILVSDRFKPADPQPASILSGGESFMASLSLALALSSLRSDGMMIDILFIDEGFGTLSPEYLNNVMETLERLHQIGGRRVGLISHVPEMKERIPVHIEVTRESPALSRLHLKS